MTPAFHLVLEFARAEAAGQPHGFRFAPKTYLLRNPGGDFAAAELPWTRELLADLRALRGGVPDPDVAHRIGAVLHQFLAASAWPAHEPAIVRATRTGVRVVSMPRCHCSRSHRHLRCSPCHPASRDRPFRAR